MFQCRVVVLVSSAREPMEGCSSGVCFCGGAKQSWYIALICNFRVALYCWVNRTLRRITTGQLKRWHSLVFHCEIFIGGLLGISPALGEDPAGRADLNRDMDLLFKGLCVCAAASTFTGISKFSWVFWTAIFRSVMTFLTIECLLWRRWMQYPYSYFDGIFIIITAIYSRE